MASISSSALGICFLALYVLSAVVFAQVAQFIGTGQEGSYSKPYFQTYLYHSVWVAVVPVALGMYYLEKRVQRRHNPILSYPEIPYRQLLQWALFSGPATVMGSFSFLLMAARLNLSVASTISQCSFLITVAFSFFFLGERITLIKAGASIVCVTGLLMTAFGSLIQDEVSNLVCCKWSGYLLLVGSMILDAGYQVAWAYIMNPIKAPFGRALSLGFMGIAATGCSTLFFGWIGVVVGNFTGWETFELPPSGPALNGVVLACSMDFVLNLSILIAIGFTSPTFVSVGGLMVIPLIVILQFALYGSLPSALEWIGVALVLAGSLMFEIGDALYRKFASRRNQVLFLTADNEELKQETERILSPK